MKKLLKMFLDGKLTGGFLSLLSKLGITIKIVWDVPVLNRRLALDNTPTDLVKTLIEDKQILLRLDTNKLTNEDKQLLEQYSVFCDWVLDNDWVVVHKFQGSHSTQTTQPNN